MERVHIGLNYIEEFKSLKIVIKKLIHVCCEVLKCSDVDALDAVKFLAVRPSAEKALRAFELFMVMVRIGITSMSPNMST